MIKHSKIIDSYICLDWSNTIKWWLLDPHFVQPVKPVPFPRPIPTPLNLLSTDVIHYHQSLTSHASLLHTSSFFLPLRHSPYLSKPTPTISDTFPHLLSFLFSKTQARWPVINGSCHLGGLMIRPSSCHTPVVDHVATVFCFSWLISGVCDLQIDGWEGGLVSVLHIPPPLSPSLPLGPRTWPVKSAVS